MKQGNKYLYSNGRGNYGPVSIYERQWVKKCEKRLKENNYDTKHDPNGRRRDEAVVNSHKHGVGLRVLRKGLNSKLRHMAKREINKELENYD